jgi:FkbM family methyltransferase
VKASFFGLAWALVRPLRAYLRHSPPGRVHGVVEFCLTRAILPLAPETFVAKLPSGGELELSYRERIGLSTLLNGPFETAEVAALCRLAESGSTAVDVGANVGIFTIPLAFAVGARGRVLAFEPGPQTAARLRANVGRNALANVDVFECALGERAGPMTLRLGSDGAFNAVVDLDPASGPTVRLERLDDVWRRSGSPRVSMLKIDVEGGELGVLEGARELVEAMHPVILLEAADPAVSTTLSEWLELFHYTRRSEPGFQPWNHLFVPTASHSGRRA